MLGRDTSIDTACTHGLSQTDMPVSLRQRPATGLQCNADASFVVWYTTGMARPVRGSRLFCFMVAQYPIWSLASISPRPVKGPADYCIDTFICFKARPGGSILTVDGSRKLKQPRDSCSSFRRPAR